jgi:hypothetical protein
MKGAHVSTCYNIHAYDRIGIKACPVARLSIAIAIGVGAILIFCRLGHYALWDDEALTALIGLGVWRTGDTPASVGDNLVAYQYGYPIVGGHERATPPLPSFLVAPLIGMIGVTPHAARLPFAICGIACVSLMLVWSLRCVPDRLTLFVAILAVLGNVSLLLYARQCRYYSVVMLASVAATCCYFYRESTRWWRVGFWLSMTCVIGSNYLCFLALYTCFVVDHLAWGRRIPLSTADHALAILFPAVVGGALLAVWNPARMFEAALHTPGNWWADRLVLIWWNFRDANRCEYGPGALVVIAPILAVVLRRRTLLRAVTALAVYVMAASVVSPQQPLSASHLVAVANVRYICPVIPLSIAVSVLVLYEIRRFCRPLALGLGVLGYLTNALCGAPYNGMPLRSTLVSYIRELAVPVPEPFTPTARWLASHVARHKTVLVLPTNNTYPLMFLAPEMTYAWQLDPTRRRIPGAKPTDYWGIVAPDYIVAFGPEAALLRQRLIFDGGRFPYRLEAVVMVYFEELYRPEIFWHSFSQVSFQPRSQAVFIYTQSTSTDPIRPSRDISRTPGIPNNS